MTDERHKLTEPKFSMLFRETLDDLSREPLLNLDSLESPAQALPLEQREHGVALPLLTKALLVNLHEQRRKR